VQRDLELCTHPGDGEVLDAIDGFAGITPQIEQFGRDVDVIVQLVTAIPRHETRGR
jgi:hypothetical protein